MIASTFIFTAIFVFSQVQGFSFSLISKQKIMKYTLEFIENLAEDISDSKLKEIVSRLLNGILHFKHGEQKFEKSKKKAISLMSYFVFLTDENSTERLTKNSDDIIRELENGVHRTLKSCCKNDSSFRVLLKYDETNEIYECRAKDMKKNIIENIGSKVMDKIKSFGHHETLNETPKEKSDISKTNITYKIGEEWLLD